MKVGECYSWMLFLVRFITAFAKVPIDGHEYYFTNYGLLYDIGCKFQAYVKRADPELYLHTKIRVNAFHIKAHELMCRILWGPRRAVGFGESDGEGCERDWSDKAHLVASGRSSNSAERTQILSAQSQHYATRMRIALPRLLDGKLQKARKNLTKFVTNREEIRSTVLPGMLSDDVISKQAELQVTFFKGRRITAREQREEKEIYKALVREKEVLDRIARYSR